MSRLLIKLASLTALLVLVAGQELFAQSNEESSPTGFRFLTIGGGARAVGLAETMVADAQDAFVTEYNPAGLVSAERFAVGFSHNVFFQDTRGEYVGMVAPAGKWGFGGRLAYVGSTDIPLRTGPSTEPLGQYDAASGVIQGAIGRVIDDRLSVGLSAAYVVEHVESESATSAILGIGARYRTHRNFHLGIAFANVGPKAKFVEQEVKMPNLVRFGGLWSNERLSLRGEIVAADSEKIRWHFGSEFFLDPRLALRAGGRLGYDTQFFSAGLGVRTPDGRIGVDYAFAPYSDDLGNTHRFGLVIRP